MYNLYIFCMLCSIPVTLGEGSSCPEQKTVGDICYERDEEDVDTSSYECTANCTYKKKDYSDDDERFCFKPGDLPVTDGCVDTGPDVNPTDDLIPTVSDQEYLSCFDDNTAYSYGEYIVAGVENFQPTKYDCQKSCSVHNTCNFWTWGKKGTQVYGRCYLKIRKTIPGVQLDYPDYISGPKFCGDSPACSPDGNLLPTSLPQDPSLWSPSAHFNPTIIGLSEDEKASLKLAFDQALLLAAAFNHGLAYRTLLKAYKSSASSSTSFQCCLCLWALAYLNAPNLNQKCTSSRLAAAKNHTREASQSCLSTKNALERDLVSAMVARFPIRCEDETHELIEEFALKMAEIAAANKGKDNALLKADLHCLHTEAVMMTTAWDYYKKDGTLKDEVKPAQESLELAISIAPDHPIANHLTIHLFEASNDLNLITKAENAGDNLKRIIPRYLGVGLGHLLHMPSHAYTRAISGRYHEGVLANMAGIKDDFKYFSDCPVPQEDYYRLNYYAHKHAFLIWAATMSGESKIALDFTKKLIEHVDIVKVATNPAMKGSVKFSYPNWQYQILLTFGKFAEMEALSPPDRTVNKLLDTYMKTMFFFARSYARASLGNCAQSRKDYKLFLSYASNEELRNRNLSFINGGNLLDLSKHILKGRLCGKCEGCSEVKHLKKAVDIQDDFPYDEPRYWPDHVRACLGAALLRENKTEQALAEFEKDLTIQHFPNNGWSLKGKELALRALGRDKEAEKVALKFFEAWKFSDVDLKEPCF